MNYSELKGKYMDPYLDSDLPFTNEFTEIDWLKANHIHVVREIPVSEILWKGKYN